MVYLSLGVPRREDAKECLADEGRESLCASLRSRKYSSPPLLNGNGVILSGTGFSSTHDSVKKKTKNKYKYKVHKLLYLLLH